MIMKCKFIWRLRPRKRPVDTYHVPATAGDETLSGNGFTKASRFGLFGYSLDWGNVWRIGNNGDYMLLDDKYASFGFINSIKIVV
jgi:hypothetical protein